MRPLLVWLGSHELAVLLGVVGLAAGILVFGAIAGEVIEGDMQAFDRTVLMSMRHPSDRTPIGSPAVQEAARDITALGGVTVLALLTSVVAGFLWLEGKTRMALFVCGSIGSGFVVSGILKEIFHRPRPDLVPHAVYVATASFPSGHSMLSAVTYLTLGALLARTEQRLRLKAYFLLVAVTLTFMIGVTRVYLGVHWPTDVLAGWTAGGSWALVCWLAARGLQRRQALERATESKPPS